MKDKISSRRNIWLDGIMGLVIGDALGLPVQFWDREELKENPVDGMRGYGTYNMPAGTWSDDSSMALATMESIKVLKTVEREDIMERFVEWLCDGEYTPYGKSFDMGNTCCSAILNYRRNKNPDTCGVTGEYANGNGALMRIMPVCLFAYEKMRFGMMSEQEAVETVQMVSALTHNHMRSQMACGMYYFLVCSILNGSGTLNERIQEGISAAETYYRRDIANYVEFSRYGRLLDIKDFAVLEETQIKSTGYVVDSIEAAIWSLLNTDSFESCLIKAVNLGDDTDTVGAIAGGLAGLYYGYENMPADWRDTIAKKEDIILSCENMKEKFDV